MARYEVFSIYSDKHIQFECSCNNMYCEIGMSSPGSAELLLRLSEEGDQVSRLLICSYQHRVSSEKEEKKKKKFGQTN